MACRHQFALQDDQRAFVRSGTGLIAWSGGLTQKNGTDQRQSVAGNVPRLIVPKFGHKSSVDEDCCAQKEYEREKSDTRVQCGIPLGKLEIQGNVVNGDEASRVRSRSKYKQQYGLLVLDELNREHSILDSGEQGENLLKREEDNKHGCNNKEGNDLAAAPGVERPAEADGHDDGN